MTSGGAIQELNQAVANDPHMTAVLVTIRDGILAVWENG
jgi:predicted O-methyltransferase YrrM